jgi:hypothetical protein
METGVGVIYLEFSAMPEKEVPLCERGVMTVRKQHGLGHPSKQSYTRPSP